jgi:hypothetical protein
MCPHDLETAKRRRPQHIHTRKLINTFSGSFLPSFSDFKRQVKERTIIRTEPKISIKK